VGYYLGDNFSREVFNRIREGSGITFVLLSILWIVIFVNTATINQHFINNWIYVIGCLVLAFPVSALLVILIVMLKIKLEKIGKGKGENK